MAQRVQVILEDDLNGGSADETVRFGIDGKTYEIDLSSDNAKKLRKSLRPYVENARRAGGTKQRRTRQVSSRRQSAEIRAWAKAQGIEVSERGRIPAEVMEKYESAH
ncbi:MAG: Lsr2 family protein [Streptosporangiales bacterium]|nr:Lsr2 family protein [Streptosporangiales bacterium]